jgi:hypothetical protein
MCDPDAGVLWTCVVVEYRYLLAQIVLGCRIQQGDLRVPLYVCLHVCALAGMLASLQKMHWQHYSERVQAQAAAAMKRAGQAVQQQQALLLVVLQVLLLVLMMMMMSCLRRTGEPWSSFCSSGTPFCAG